MGVATCMWERSMDRLIWCVSVAEGMSHRSRVLLSDVYVVCSCCHTVVVVAVDVVHVHPHHHAMHA